MTMETKRNVFAEHLPAWLAAKGNRAKRRELVAHLAFITTCHPKSVPRSFRRVQLRDPATEDGRGRPTRYGPDVTAALAELWHLTEEPCGELLHDMIGDHVTALTRTGEWRHGPETTVKLLAMSVRTVKRRVAGFAKIYHPRHGMSATSPSALHRIIPIFKGPWHDLPPGHGQIDTVAHCGDSLAGDFIYTVNYTDTATYWVVPRAQWQKGQEATVGSMAAIRARMPFLILGMHPDSGGEFINWVAKGWCEAHGIALSRSEPYRKNDNMYVEERNGHVVRKHLGWERLDDHAIVPILNEFYDLLTRALNHFRVVRRTVSKERVGAKYVRRYEKQAKTPYQRVLEHPLVPDDVKQRLRAEHETLNPLLLKRKLDTLKAKIFSMQEAARNRRRPSEFR